MKEIDKTVKMLDSGTALLCHSGGFGPMLGQVRAELLDFGTSIFSSKDCSSMGNFPPSGGEGWDFFLDFSSALRKRYISCTVFDAGDTGRVDSEDRPIRKYAVEIRSGWKDTPLSRGILCILPLSILILLIWGPLPWWANLLCLLIAALSVWALVTPDRKTSGAARKIRHSLEALSM